MIKVANNKEPRWLGEDAVKELGEVQERDGNLYRYRNQWYFANEVDSELRGPFDDKGNAQLTMIQCAALL